MDICDDYGEDVPKHPDYPTCPISFSDSERQQQKDDISFHRREMILGTMMELMFAERELAYNEDGCVPVDQLERAQAAAARVYQLAKERLGEERVHELDAAWPPPRQVHSGLGNLHVNLCT